ncbi:hypothetical protein GCM10023331_05130 [Algivirga pacifica]|uniref:RlpA-like protein double-psi beta-barrel domain-containing protein n=2 Tax=Algivirga pacifica TaxID=1162670 RepID=A0ABP9CZN2_9BACT
MINIVQYPWIRTALTLLVVMLGSTSMYAQKSFVGKVELGTATYYADRYNGRETLNGDVFDNNLMTCAVQRSMFDSNTLLKVTNIDNGKSVIVKSNDALNPNSTAIIDLTKAAFKQIAEIREGRINIKVEALKTNVTETPPQNQGTLLAGGELGALEQKEAVQQTAQSMESTVAAVPAANVGTDDVLMKATVFNRRELNEFEEEGDLKYKDMNICGHPTLPAGAEVLIKSKEQSNAIAFATVKFKTPSLKVSQKVASQINLDFNSQMWVFVQTISAPETVATTPEKDEALASNTAETPALDPNTPAGLPALQTVGGRGLGVGHKEAVQDVVAVASPVKETTTPEPTVESIHNTVTRAPEKEVKQTLFMEPTADYSLFKKRGKYYNVQGKPTTPANSYGIQLAMHYNIRRALKSATDAMSKDMEDIYIHKGVHKGMECYRVYFGAYTKEEAGIMLDAVKDLGYKDAFLKLYK